jgi:putative transposase
MHSSRKHAPTSRCCARRRLPYAYKQSEAGAKTSELCRQHGISTATFYGWRSKYGGLEVSEAKRLKQLEEENAKLKRIVADQALDITMLKDLVGKKW